jgi:hypothetical protein
VDERRLARVRAELEEFAAAVFAGLPRSEGPRVSRTMAKPVFYAAS